MEGDFAAPSWKIHRIGRESKSRDTGFKFLIKGHPLFEGRPELSRAGGKIQLEEVIGRNAQVETCPKKIPQGFGVIINTPEQDRLYMNGNSRLYTPDKLFLRLGGQFPGMVEVDHHSEGTVNCQKLDKLWSKPFRIGNREPGTEAQEHSRFNIP
jgi:hypothetical protein